jgi:hypothetical protein
MSAVRTISIFLGASLVACEADFEGIDLSPDDQGLGPADAGAAPPDAGASPVDAGGVDSGVADAGAQDSGESTDTGQAPADETVLATMEWEPSGYSVSGTSEIVQRSDGGLEIRFSSDFRSVQLPGPVLFFSDRGDIGRSGIREADGDVRIGPIPQPFGPLVFDVPADALDRTFAWIYCEPFSAEMHIATLELQ